MSLKIIGAGFGRTGTTSLKAALEQLGFDKCHHMTEVYMNPTQAESFLAINRGETADWDTLLDGYQATTDWPCCTFYKELMAHYPDAKVILSVRDPERWYASCRNTIYRTEHEVPRWFFRVDRRFSGVQQLSSKQVWQGTFEGRFEDKPFVLGIFEKHKQEVIDTVPADRLLVFEVKQGWEPLCEFLGVPVPDTSFPHLNDGKIMSRFFNTLPYVPWVALGLVLLIVYFLVSSIF